MNSEELFGRLGNKYLYNKISREKGITEISSMVMNGIIQFLHEWITGSFDALKGGFESI